MASTSDSHVLLEAMASPAQAKARTHTTRRSPSSSDPTRSQSQRLLAHGEIHCQRRGTEQRMAARPRTAQHEVTLGRACSASSNRLVRTRMLGGVGRVPGNGHPYPIMRPHLYHRFLPLTYSALLLSPMILDSSSIKSAFSKRAASWWGDRAGLKCGSGLPHFLINLKIMPILENKAIE